MVDGHEGRLQGTARGHTTGGAPRGGRAAARPGRAPVRPPGCASRRPWPEPGPGRAAGPAPGPCRCSLPLRQRESVRLGIVPLCPGTEARARGPH